MLFLILMLSLVQPPFDVLVDYPKTVEGSFEVITTIVNNDALPLEGMISACLDKNCMPSKSFSVKTKESFNYSFNPNNETMKLKVIIKTKYGEKIVERDIMMKEAKAVPKNYSTVKANSLKVLPMPSNAAMIFDSGEQANRTCGMLLLSGICVILAVILVWRR